MSDETAVRLHATTDAQVWAKEWCRIAREIDAAGDDRQVIDEGWMIGWFANAIETGRDHAVCPYVVTSDEGTSFCRLAADTDGYAGRLADFIIDHMGKRYTAEECGRVLEVRGDG